jgi:hypothetical protein
VLLVAILVAPLGVRAAGLDANVYVIHGIPGQDLGLPNELPVDIKINGNVALTNVPFGGIAGPLTVPAGKYEVEVRVAAAEPGAGPLAMAGTFYLAVTENATIVAHLTEEGIPKLTKFINDMRPFSNNMGTRLVARHGASAPNVNVGITGKETYRFLYNLSNGNQAGLDLKAGSYKAGLYPTLSLKPVFGPVEVSLDAGTAYFVYAVGSLRSGSFNLVVHPIPVQ